MLCVNQTLNTMNTQTGPLQSTETSSLVRGDWWWSSWRVQSNYVINLGNCGESLWCSLLLHMISTCVCSTHMYVSHAVCSQILAYTYTCTHIHTIAHFNAPFQHGLSRFAVKVAVERCHYGWHWQQLKTKHLWGVLWDEVTKFVCR